MSRGPRSISVTLVIAALGLVMLTGCGKKGPPLPPLPPEKGALLYKTTPDEAEAISVERAADRNAEKESS